MATFSFSQKASKLKLKNTSISAPDGSTLYEISTPKKMFGSAPTTVWRYDRGNGRTEVAVIENHSWSNDKVAFHGASSVAAKKFLVKPRFWSCARDMKTPCGTFRWKVKKEKPELFLSNRPVVHFNRNRRHLFGGKSTAGKNSSLVVDPQAQPIMDYVVVGFLLMHHFIVKTKQKEEGVAAIADAVGNVAGG